MRWVFICLLIVFSGCASYHPKPLTKAQIAGEVAFEIVNAIDWGQTLDIVDRDEYYEMNPLITKNPSRARVNLIMGAIALGHPLITWVMPDSWRWYWIGGTTIGKGITVVHNKSIGLGVNF